MNCNTVFCYLEVHLLPNPATSSLPFTVTISIADGSNVMNDMPQQAWFPKGSEIWHAIIFRSDNPWGTRWTWAINCDHNLKKIVHGHLHRFDVIKSYLTKPQIALWNSIPFEYASPTLKPKPSNATLVRWHIFNFPFRPFKMLNLNSQIMLEGMWLCLYLSLPILSVSSRNRVLWVIHYLLTLLIIHVKIGLMHDPEMAHVLIWWGQNQINVSTVNLHS